MYIYLCIHTDIIKVFLLVMVVGTEQGMNIHAHNDSFVTRAYIYTHTHMHIHHWDAYIQTGNLHNHAHTHTHTHTHTHSHSLTHSTHTRACQIYSILRHPYRNMSNIMMHKSTFGTLFTHMLRFLLHTLAYINRYIDFVIL